jgi:hypothetical protein
MAMAGDLICWSGGVNAPAQPAQPGLTMKFDPAVTMKINLVLTIKITCLFTINVPSSFAPAPESVTTAE